MLFKNYRNALPNPDRMNLGELQNFSGRSMRIVGASMKSMRMSMPFIGISVGSTLVLSYFVGRYMAN